MYRVAMIVFATVISLSAQSAQNAKVETPNLWAAISVQEPIFQIGWKQSVQMSFALVNDGPSTVDPEINSSHLFINGVELGNWPLVIGSGPKQATFSALPAGRFLLFGYSLEKYFSKPGTYTVRWEGRHFRSKDLVLRVLAMGN